MHLKKAKCHIGNVNDSYLRGADNLGNSKIQEHYTSWAW